MNMQMCKNGHFYNADEETECPHCGKDAEEGNRFPQTGIITDFPSVGCSMKQMDQREKKKPTGWNPVLGWLVCVQGEKLGKDFRLTQAVNYVGCAASNDVCLGFDKEIAENTILTIDYEKQRRVFRLNVEQSQNPVFVNDILVYSQLDLRDKDIISLGTTRLKLICFCDASFAWEN